MEPFKKLMSPEVVGFIAMHLGRHDADLSEEEFKSPLLERLPSLELKQRTQLIADAVRAALASSRNTQQIELKDWQI